MEKVLNILSLKSIFIENDPILVSMHMYISIYIVFIVFYIQYIT